MGEDNPLVAEPEGRSPLAGTFLGYDGYSLVTDMAQGHWLAAGLDAVATGLDVAATVSNPIGALLEAGIGWVLDHLEPLKGWLDDLTGDPELVRSYGGTWENVARELEAVASTLRSQVSGDLAGMTGSAVDAYRSFADELAGGLEHTASMASETAASFTTLGTVVDVVHGLVRDILSAIVAYAISSLAEEIFSLGLATPLVVEQISTKVADGVAQVGSKVRGVVESCEALKSVITKVDTAIEDAQRALNKINPALGSEGPRHLRAPGEEPATTVKPHDDAPAGEAPAGEVPAGEAPSDGATDGSHDGTPAPHDEGPQHREEPGSVSDRIREDLTTVKGYVTATHAEESAGLATTARDGDRKPEPVP